MSRSPGCVGESGARRALTVCVHGTGNDRPQREGHGTHQSRAQHLGGGQASIHRRSHLRLPDRGQAVPHPGVPQR